MGLMDFFKRHGSDSIGQRLLGVWTAPGIEIEIRSDGTMDYTTIEAGRRQIMKLTYRIMGEEIISNQPSAPREERTKFSLNGSELVLTFDGERTTFRRVGR